eukprot:4819479-Amphidinium_carterae.1
MLSSSTTSSSTSSSTTTPSSTTTRTPATSTTRTSPTSSTSTSTSTSTTTSTTSSTQTSCPSSTQFTFPFSNDPPNQQRTRIRLVVQHTEIDDVKIADSCSATLVRHTDQDTIYTIHCRQPAPPVRASRESESYGSFYWQQLQNGWHHVRRLARASVQHLAHYAPVLALANWREHSRFVDSDVAALFKYVTVSLFDFAGYSDISASCVVHIDPAKPPLQPPHNHTTHHYEEASQPQHADHRQLLADLCTSVHQTWQLFHFYISFLRYL